MAEALKQIQGWLLTTNIIEDKEQLYNESFIKANNLTVKALQAYEASK